MIIVGVVQKSETATTVLRPVLFGKLESAPTYY